MVITTKSTAGAVARWFEVTFLNLGREFRWSYLPPLMVYVAAGVSGLTSIVGTFFIKDYLGLSAAFLATLSFWAGIPWALKMPLGHLVDLIWRWKALLVYLGATLIAGNVGIMYGLVSRPDAMARVMPVEMWFVVATLAAPIGYVLQDVVADAMTVEAVPTLDPSGEPLPEAEVTVMHVTMQTLGRVAIIGGTLFVAVLNIVMFSGVEAMTEADKVGTYADIYLMAFSIPFLSILGVTLGEITAYRRRALAAAADVPAPGTEAVQPNWWILGGSLVFAIVTLGVGVGAVPYAQEMIFAGSMAIVVFLMNRLLKELPESARAPLVGTAIVVFVFRAVPLPGDGVSWWQIDALGFDQQFLSVLTLITSSLTLLGMFLFRPLIASRSIGWVMGMLTIAGGLLSLPIIGLYYGVHHWTAALTGGIVDARFIAIANTALESPLGQVAMIPMLAWIAKNAPPHLKATFFAVMASFTNLALSASALGTKYLNHIFIVTREVRDRQTGAITIPADYSELGWLLITVTVIAVAAPLLAIVIVDRALIARQADRPTVNPPQT